MPNKYTVELTSPTVLTVKFDDVKTGWEQWIMVASDNHHDSIHCDRKLEKQHLEKAKERNALIIWHGDVFDVMQGKFDPRSSMNDIRPEDVGVDYLDRIVMHAAEDYAPYAKNFLLLGKGNHEQSILNRHGVDLISNLCHRLNANGGSVHAGRQSGWVRFLFVVQKTKRTAIRYKYQHGSGGTDSQVTLGVIQTNRQAVYLPDADIVVNGHNHKGYAVPLKRERLSNGGKQYFDIAWFLRTPGYKFAYGADGWEDGKMHAPPSNGCCWVRFSHNPCSSNREYHGLIDVECIQDVK